MTPLPNHLGKRSDDQVTSPEVIVLEVGQRKCEEMAERLRLSIGCGNRDSRDCGQEV